MLGIAIMAGLLLASLWQDVESETPPQPAVTSEQVASGPIVDRAAVDEPVPAAAASASMQPGIAPQPSAPDTAATMSAPAATGFMGGTGRVFVKASALVAAGVDADVAAEIVHFLDWHAAFIVMIRSIEMTRRSQPKSARTLAAADILFAIAPELPDLIRDGAVVVETNSVPHRHRFKGASYDIRADGSGFQVKFQGQDQDIGIRIQAAGSGVPNRWRALREATGASSAVGRGR